MQEAEGALSDIRAQEKRSIRFRNLEEVQERRAFVGVALGTRKTRLAHRVLSDGALSTSTLGELTWLAHTLTMS